MPWFLNVQQIWNSKQFCYSHNKNNYQHCNVIHWLFTSSQETKTDKRVYVHLDDVFHCLFFLIFPELIWPDWFRDNNGTEKWSFCVKFQKQSFMTKDKSFGWKQPECTACVLHCGLYIIKPVRRRLLYQDMAWSAVQRWQWCVAMSIMYLFLILRFFSLVLSSSIIL